MKMSARLLIALLLLAALVASAYGLLHAGIYGFAVFVTIPVALGGLASWTVQSTTGPRAAGTGVLAVLVATLSLLLMREEGIMCIVMCLPITLPLGAAGGYAAYLVSRSRAAARGTVAIFLLLPPTTLAYDTHAQPAVYTVKTSIEIAAPPEKVWQKLIGLSQIPGPSEWYFRAGLAYPTSARIEGAGSGAARYCDFSTGPVVETIEVWDAPRVLRFRVTATPAPMREWNPFGDISPKHLHGYMLSREGEFRLAPLPGKRTLLAGTSWYQHGLWPAQYWRLWTDAIVHRIHLRVFRQIKALAEHS